MRPSKFSEAQILDAIREVEGGLPAARLCRSLGVTETTFYRWRRKYGGAASADVSEVRQLRDENRKLKQIVANLLLERLD